MDNFLSLDLPEPPGRTGHQKRDWSLSLSLFLRSGGLDIRERFPGATPLKRPRRASQNAKPAKYYCTSLEVEEDWKRKTRAISDGLSFIVEIASLA